MPNRNARIGLILFFVYLALFYGGFVLLAAFSPATMARIPWAGVNLAIWYGFALIAAALFLALIYGWLCRIEVVGTNIPNSEPGRPRPAQQVTHLPPTPPPKPEATNDPRTLALSPSPSSWPSSASRSASASTWAASESRAGYFAARGQIHWFVNGVAFAGDYLSAASFLGICGMIAFYGYDGFLYSIGYLAGWIVALFVIAEPIKRLGKLHLRRRARRASSTRAASSSPPASARSSSASSTSSRRWSAPARWSSRCSGLPALGRRRAWSAPSSSSSSSRPAWSRPPGCSSSRARCWCCSVRRADPGRDPILTMRRGFDAATPPELRRIADVVVEAGATGSRSLRMNGLPAEIGDGTLGEGSDCDDRRSRSSAALPGRAT